MSPLGPENNSSNITITYCLAISSTNLPSKINTPTKLKSKVEFQMQVHICLNMRRIIQWVLVYLLFRSNDKAPHPGTTINN